MKSLNAVASVELRHMQGVFDTTHYDGTVTLVWRQPCSSESDPFITTRLVNVDQVTRILRDYEGIVLLILHFAP